VTAEHWDGRYADETAVSWYEPQALTSIDRIAAVADPAASVVDVGGGSSRLVDALLARGHRDVTVIDISQAALSLARGRVGVAPVSWVCADVRDWHPDRAFDVWHDRAAYHFLVDPDDQERYWRLVREAVPVGGHVIVATFAAGGPTMCSGLPVQRYDASALATAMGPGFAVVSADIVEHTTPGGAVQPFQWMTATRTP
jgi:2-polyprenyl-3-methyl-5-hydroxy-6-metoxy-1,4-benzoquinol methylase